KRTWAAYGESPMPIDAYSAGEIRSLELSGGTCVAIRPDTEGEGKRPVFEDTGIFTTFKLRGLATAYDWMAPHLSAEERREVTAMLGYQGDRLYHHALNGNALLLGSILNHTWLDTAGLGLAGLALYHEHPVASEWVRFCRDRFVDTLLPRTIGVDGEFPEACPYVWEYSYMSAALFFEALHRVTGEDLLAHPAFRRVARMLNRALTPAGGLAFDDDMMGFDRADGVGYSFRPLMFRFASKYRDAEAQRYALYPGFEPAGADRGKFYPGGRWFPERREYNGHWEYLWCDESLPAASDVAAVSSPSAAGVPSSLLRSTGVALLRTGWGPTDTYVAFRAGPYLGHHDRFDQCKFVLQAGGEKLLEHLYGANYRHFDYFKYTPGSNTILVNGQGQETVPEGGQHTTFMEQYQGRRPNGSIVFFAATPDHDAVVGDASTAYGDRLSHFRRYLAFIKPHTILVLDDLVAPEPASFDWLAHSYGDIDITGSDVSIRKPAAGVLIRAVLPEAATWHLEETPPDSNGRRLRKHLALRPPERTVHQRFLTALYVSPTGRDAFPVTVEEGDGRITARLQMADGAKAVIFDLSRGQVRFQ
ncbi:MAG: heparinase II/III domain-containing protein, partial [Anaerolineae bacterium]